jgi:2-polyprenyl-3-methyl-5-hydroxy-6-metoxy-1,4-benzoquinol methylase
MKRNSQDLEKIAHLALEHYNQYAEEFWQGTRDHDVSQNIAALLQYIRNEPPFKILDFGCGPGRDLKTFAELGHIAIGLEGAEHLAVMARAHSGCEVWQQDFLKARFTGELFRWCVRQRRAVSCTQPGTAARIAGTESKSETWRCSLQLESAWS